MKLIRQNPHSDLELKKLIEEESVLAVRAFGYRTNAKEMSEKVILLLFSDVHST